MDKLDVQPTEIPSGEITNQESAQRWVEGLVQDMVKWRNRCDVVIPDPTSVAAQVQRRALWVFLTKQGEVTGALKALLLSGMISERCYKELHQKAINTLIPTVVGRG